MSNADFKVVRGGSGLVLVAVPGAWLATELDDTDNDQRTAERPETLREVLARYPAAVAALDGAMFDAEGEYPTYARARLSYRNLDVARGINSPGRYPTRGATLSRMRDGRLVMLDGDAIADGATWAAQGYPTLIHRGDNVANPNRDANTTGRAALCLLADGRAGFATARCGMHAFARELLALREVRVTDAAYTDGGGSTGLALREGSAFSVSVGLDARRLPVYLLALPPAGAVADQVARGVGGVLANAAASGLVRALKVAGGVALGAVALGAVAVGVERVRAARAARAVEGVG